MEGLALQRLNQQQKELLWGYLKTQFPNKAREISVLMKDPNVKDMLETFGASIMLEIEYVPRSLLHLVEKG